MSALTFTSAAASPAWPAEITAAAGADGTALIPRQLKVGGVTPFSATDYPGKLAAVVFVQGCPWRCGYCHNPHLQPRSEHSPLPWTQVLALLRRRTGLIDAVVFSGGEPTMDPVLADAMRQVRALGFGIGLHSAGAYPRRLAQVLPLVDWVGLDIKAEPHGYDAVTGIRDSAGAALTSARMVLASGVAHEFRTTVHPALHAEHDILALAHSLSRLGVKRYALQKFRAIGCANEDLNQMTNPDFLSAKLVAQVGALFPEFTLRDS